MATTDFIAAIELSSSKISGIAGKKNSDGSIQVLAYAREDASSFIHKGVIYNIDKTAQALTSITNKLENQLNNSIAKVYVGIGGQSLRTVKNAVSRTLDEEGIISQELVDSICDENLEVPLADTFRAKPERVEILKELCVDLANLANNHIYDYGTDAFLDTLDILDAGGIAHAGAGKNAVEAEEPFYAEIDGRTVAVVSATRAEKYILTPEADEDNPGVFRCYDMAKVLQKVQETKEKADFVIAYIHWGTEYSETLETAQTEGDQES